MDRQTTEACLFYKITHESKGSGELKISYINLNNIPETSRKTSTISFIPESSAMICLCYMRTTKVQISLHIRVV